MIVVKSSDPSFRTIRENMAVSTRCFFDFYTMYELYMRAGGFREAGYKHYSVIINQKIWERITSKYEEVVDSFYDELYHALVDAIKQELRHFPSECTSYHDESAGNYISTWKMVCIKGNTTIDQLKNVSKNLEKHPEIAVKVFTIPEWDPEFGGRKWAKASQMLVESKKIKTRHEKVLWCDRVLDLYHNSGHLLNKTDFASLSIKCVVLPSSGRLVKPLTLRAKACSILHFISYCSPSVRNLVLPRRHLLDTV